MIFLGYLNFLESARFADPASFVRWSQYSSAEVYNKRYHHNNIETIIM